MLKSTERLVAFAILHQAYSSQKPASNPFINLIINAACDDAAEKFERAFILQLLGIDGSSNSREVFPQLDQLQQQFSVKEHPEQYKCLCKDSSVKSAVPDPDIPHGCDANSPEYGSTMPYYFIEELHEIKVGFLWWLVTHPHNIHREKVLSLIEESHKRKRNK